VEEYFVRYVFEENSEKKQYGAHMKAKGGSDPHYLVQALADAKEGDDTSQEDGGDDVVSDLKKIHNE
jgi:hypothetical protein